MLLCAIFTLALASVVKGQTDAFEFNWPGDTDQCSVRPFFVVVDCADR
jgi:hypothetical protein